MAKRRKKINWWWKIYEIVSWAIVVGVYVFMAYNISDTTPPAVIHGMRIVGYVIIGVFLVFYVFFWLGKVLINKIRGKNESICICV